METVLTNAYTCSDQKSKLLEQKNYSKEKYTSKKCHFFTKWHFEKFINRMKGSYEITWKFSYGN